jgi:maleylacetoacetate isomerase
MKLYTFWRSLATFRVRIALNLKGLATSTAEVNLMKGHQRQPEFHAVNPMMAIPALDLEDGKPALFESLAIIEYLDEIHPNPPLLPQQPRARARVRAISQLIACDAHPLVVPRVRDYLEHELKLPEPVRTEWCRHWSREALKALEIVLRDSETGRYCQGDQVTIADICLAGHMAGATFFAVDTSPYPAVLRIAGELQKIDAFARAHPLKQPGAPA